MKDIHVLEVNINEKDMNVLTKDAIRIKKKQNLSAHRETLEDSENAYENVVKDGVIRVEENETKEEN